LCFKIVFIFSSFIFFSFISNISVFTLCSFYFTRSSRFCRKAINQSEIFGTLDEVATLIGMGFTGFKINAFECTNFQFNSVSTNLEWRNNCRLIGIYRNLLNSLVRGGLPGITELALDKWQAAITNRRKLKQNFISILLKDVFQQNFSQQLNYSTIVFASYIV
jgi:hypothetical protein